MRERVLERASYQCEYTGPGGVRCTARTRLEIDHVDPYAKGGAGSEENLRVLCRAHNLFSAAREFGEYFMRGKIEGTAENHSSRWKKEELNAAGNRDESRPDCSPSSRRGALQSGSPWRRPPNFRPGSLDPARERCSRGRVQPPAV